MNADYSTTPHLNNLTRALDAQEGGQSIADRQKMDPRISSIAATTLLLLQTHTRNNQQLETQLKTLSRTADPNLKSNDIKKVKEAEEVFIDQLLFLNKQHTKLSSKHLILLNSILNKNEVPDIGSLLSNHEADKEDLDAIAPYLPSVDLSNEPCKSWSDTQIKAFLAECTNATDAIMPGDTDDDTGRTF